MTVLSLTGGLAMDLGTANTLIYRRGSGIVVNEPSLVALEAETRRILAVGQEAKSYLGRTPKGMEVVRPLRCGVISDFAVAQEMIRYFLAQAGASRRLFRPKIVVGVPVGVTQLEKRAIIEAAGRADLGLFLALAAYPRDGARPEELLESALTALAEGEES